MDNRCPSCGVINSKGAGFCAACRRDLSLPPAPGDASWQAQPRQEERLLSGPTLPAKAVTGCVGLERLALG
jgi:hypothetical protein